MKTNKHIILNGNCLPVKGANRAIICDLQIGRYFHVPNTLVDILMHGYSYTAMEIYENINDEEEKILDKYYDFVIENGLAMTTSSPQQFPQIPLKWAHPGEIANAIIDISSEFFNNFSYGEVIEQLSSLGCISVQIRAFNNCEKSNIFLILEKIADSRIHDVKLLFSYKVFDQLSLKNLIINNARISEIIIFDAPENTLKQEANSHIYYFTNSLSTMDCGRVCSSNFAINIPHFTEATYYNTCLNRKISIDEVGNIKSCPSSNNIYGNILNDTLKCVLNEGGIKSKWNINKNMVNVCRDCEYRLICTDCREFTQDPENPYSKPSKCSYDPYTNTW